MDHGTWYVFWKLCPTVFKLSWRWRWRWLFGLTDDSWAAPRVCLTVWQWHMTHKGNPWKSNIWAWRAFDGEPLDLQHLQVNFVFIAGQALTWSQNMKWNMTHHSPAQAGQHFVNNLVFCHRHQLFDSTRGHLGKLLWDKLLPLLPLLNCTIAYDPGQEGKYWFLLQVCDKLLTTIKLDPACMMFGFSGRRDTHPGFPVQ